MSKKDETNPSKRNLIFSEEFPEGPYGSPKGENTRIQTKDANISYSLRRRGSNEFDDTPEA